MLVLARALRYGLVFLPRCLLVAFDLEHDLKQRRVLEPSAAYIGPPGRQKHHGKVYSWAPTYTASRASSCVYLVTLECFGAVQKNLALNQVASKVEGFVQVDERVVVMAESLAHLDRVFQKSTSSKPTQKLVKQNLDKIDGPQSLVLGHLPSSTLISMLTSHCIQDMFRGVNITQAVFRMPFKQ